MGFTNFVQRHRRKFVYLAGATLTTWWIATYIKNKLVELQEKYITERITRDSLDRRFEQNQKDATFTILALLPSLGTQIMDEFNVEATKRELQTLRSQRLKSSDGDSSNDAANSENAPNLQDPNADIGKTKAQLWEKMKVDGITRALTLVYSLALLVTFARLQLNILGRRTYVESVRKYAQCSTNSNFSSQRKQTETSVSEAVKHEEHNLVHRKYLTFSWWLLHKGWLPLSMRIKHAVEKAFETVDPRTELSYEELSEVIGRTQYEIDHPAGIPKHGNPFASIMLPPPELESYVLSQAPGDGLSADDTGCMLRELLDETADIIDSPNCQDIIFRLVHTGLSVFMSKIHEIYSPQTEKVRLVSILAIAARQAHQMAAGHPLTNEYVEAMVNLTELDAFSALIYSNY